MSQPFSLNINAAPQRAMLVTRPPAVADHSGSGSSMSEEELDFITSMSSGSTVSVYVSLLPLWLITSQLFRKPKEEKKNYIILDMQVPEYDAQRSILAQNKIPGMHRSVCQQAASSIGWYTVYFQALRLKLTASLRSVLPHSQQQRCIVNTPLTSIRLG